MTSLTSLKIKLFADGADKKGILEMYANPLISGFTTNPTLMRKAGIRNYEEFARDIVAEIPDRPISFEVFADDEVEIERQARKIATWGENVYVKIPVSTTSSAPTTSVIRRLSGDGIKTNVTALMTLKQVRMVAAVVCDGPPCYVSVFAGRIADTGRDPVPIMAEAVVALSSCHRAELIWASPREILNIVQAEHIGCHIITATSEILKKINLLGKSLDEYSLETVQMFRSDAISAGYRL